MPLTPYHWGPSSWIGLMLFGPINFFAFMAASVIVDFEPLLVFVYKFDYPLHGFLHSFLGGTLAALLLSAIIYKFKYPINKVMRLLKLSQNSAYKTILISCLAGVYLHIILDSFLYTDIRPLYPFALNPFYGIFTFSGVYRFCGWSFALGVLFYMLKVYNEKKKGTGD